MSEITAREMMKTVAVVMVTTAMAMTTMGRWARSNSRMTMEKTGC
jgi:hypothetical protein